MCKELPLSFDLSVIIVMAIYIYILYRVCDLGGAYWGAKLYGIQISNCCS